MPMGKDNKNKEDRNDFPRRRPMHRRKKICTFCTEEELNNLSYKDVAKLKKFISERGKILPRRITGTCAKHQRTITVCVKRARHLALIPYVCE